MKALLDIETNDESKFLQLLKVATEMGISVKEKIVVDEITLIAESSLAEDWDSPEDERWDELYGHLKK